METIDFNAKKGFLCDMDGVIYHGNHILPGAAEFIHWLQDTHKEYLFLTNNSGMTPRELHQKLWRMGLDVPEEHFYTSALATAAFLADQAPGCSVYALGEAGLLNALYDAPRGPRGTPRYAEIPPSERVLIQALPGESAWVRFASDGSRLAVGVSDRMGQLRRHTVLSYLERCASAQLRHQSPLEDKTSGSGVGLFLTAMAASELLFRLRQGQSTEIVFCQYLSRPRPLRVLVVDDDAHSPLSSSQT